MNTTTSGKGCEASQTSNSSKQETAIAADVGKGSKKSETFQIEKDVKLVKAATAVNNE